MGETRKSEMCRGYGLGPTCIACCMITPICMKNYEFETNFDIRFRKIPDGSLIYTCGNYGQRKASVSKFLEEGTKRFNEHQGIEKVVDTFKKAETFYKICMFADEIYKSGEFKILLEEFFNKTGFVGLVDGKPGCLLRTKFEEFIPRICTKYICEFAWLAEQNNSIPDLMKEFINSEKPDYFSYSRVIHILAHHGDLHKDLGKDINRENLNLEQLKFLHEFAHREGNYTLCDSF